MSDQKKESAMEEKRRVKCECEKSAVSTKEREEKRKENECLIENHESLKEEQVEEKQEEIEITQSQFFNLLTTSCGTKSNHGMKAKEEGMGKEPSIGYEDTSIKSCGETDVFVRIKVIKIGWDPTY
ncbi:hypothetical protein M9H77_02475 [Catharanthus roseus]|uniref:Uncharacterized protein n=1 Tax=Catharanthus roseus TaxID=4058 RepID=A0ACC0C8E5_CATRO|nr:hypothetical protein M9H77_02475 [Catharanthus roseus]